MTVRKVTIDPMTRIEGHLRFETSISDGVITDARCSGEMFRGIEKALQGHDARVAQQVTQRVCGVCPYAHAEAASLALENAMGLKRKRSLSSNGHRPLLETEELMKPSTPCNPQYVLNTRLTPHKRVMLVLSSLLILERIFGCLI